MQNWHIVYLSYESSRIGRQYIGKHSTTNLHDGYLGSYKDRTFSPDFRIILGYYKTEETAIRGEMQWQRVFQVAENDTFANQSYQTSAGFAYRVDHKGKKNPMYGKERPEHSRLMRERMSGENNPMYGKSWTEESNSKRQETWDEKYGGHPSIGRESCWKGKKRPEHAEKLRGRKRPDHAERMRQYHQKRREETANGSQNH